MFTYLHISGYEKAWLNKDCFVMAAGDDVTVGGIPGIIETLNDTIL